VALDSRNADYQAALATAEYARGEHHAARRHLERALRLGPDLARRHLQLAALWHLDWLESLDPRSIARERHELERTVGLDSAATAAWLELFGLDVLEHRPADAVRAAFRAGRTSPGLPLATLAMASACELADLPRTADSLFAAAIPGLPAAERGRFDDLDPVATRAELDAFENLPPAEQPDYVARYWNAQGADALRRFRSRTAQALFLFHDPRRPGWDERARTWIAMGPPDRMVDEPAVTPVSWSYATGPDYPARVQVWAYDGPGLKVTMRDRTLGQGYERALTRGQMLGEDDLLLADLVPRRPATTLRAAPRPQAGRESWLPPKTSR
jgi:hypothetical protein